MAPNVWKQLAKRYRSVIDSLFEAGISGPCSCGAHEICKLRAPPYCLCSCHGDSVLRLVEEQRQRKAENERLCALVRLGK
jgi:hypothetical protein